MTPEQVAESYAEPGVSEDDHPGTAPASD